VIGLAMEKLAPFKVFLYLAGGLFVIVTHAHRLPEVLALILREAFSVGALVGGTAGAGIMVAFRYGLARGIYANEAGYGTAAVAYGTAQSERPVQQGLNAVMEVFIVSLVTSNISAFTVLLSGAWNSAAVKAGEIKGAAVVAAAFETALPRFGGPMVALCVFLFGYTTLVGWSYYGEQFLEHVFGARVTLPYRWVYCLLIPFGAVGRVEVVWAWGDLMNGLQVFPNMVGLLGLSGISGDMRTLLESEAPEASRRRSAEGTPRFCFPLPDSGRSPRPRCCRMPEHAFGPGRRGSWRNGAPTER